MDGYRNLNMRCKGYHDRNRRLHCKWLEFPKARPPVKYVTAFATNVNESIPTHLIPSLAFAKFPKLVSGSG